MSARKKIVILGFGQRGQIYAGYAKAYPDKFEVAAVVDTDPEKRALAARGYNCPVYADTASYFNAPVRADAAAVAVRDCDHLEAALQCMKAGYDILLEKPVACTLDDCLRLEAEAKKHKSKIVVCHVLRYAPFYSRIKEILDEGVLGDIINIHASENVGFWHQAHSFVRGPWKNSAESAPMILAKCCHDMDILRWLIGKKPLSVSSYGGLAHFNERNAPAGAADMCSGCAVKNCVYNAQNFYTQAQRRWMAGYFCNGEKTESTILSALKGTQYDRCVYKSGNDVVDHQVTILQFGGGATACHTMTAFSKECYRDIKIYGTKGEIAGIFEENRFEVRPFAGEKYTIETAAVGFCGNHGGGDEKLMDRFYNILCGSEGRGASYLDVSMDSHKMAFGAEQSRLTGKIVEI